MKSSDTAWPVPMSRDNYSLYFLASEASNEIRFIASRITGMTGNINVTWIQEVRYILIPGGIPAGKMSSNFWQDYEAVVEFFGFDP